MEFHEVIGRSYAEAGMFCLKWRNEPPRQSGINPGIHRYSVPTDNHDATTQGYLGRQQGRIGIVSE
jgi:hypothetical protein